MDWRSFSIFGILFSIYGSTVKDFNLKSGVAGREQPSWDRENFLLPWRGRNSLCRQFLKDEPGRHKKRTDADSGQTPSVLKDRFGQRTLKIFESGWKRTVVGHASPAPKTDPTAGRRRTTNQNEPSPSGEPLLKSWWLSFSDRVA